MADFTVITENGTEFVGLALRSHIPTTTEADTRWLLSRVQLHEGALRRVLKELYDSIFVDLPTDRTLGDTVKLINNDLRYIARKLRKRYKNTVEVDDLTDALEVLIDEVLGDGALKHHPHVALELLRLFVARIMREAKSMTAVRFHDWADGFIDILEALPQAGNNLLEVVLELLVDDLLGMDQQLLAEVAGEALEEEKEEAAKRRERERALAAKAEVSTPPARAPASLLSPLAPATLSPIPLSPERRVVRRLLADGSMEFRQQDGTVVGTASPSRVHTSARTHQLRTREHAIDIESQHERGGRNMGPVVAGLIAHELFAAASKPVPLGSAAAAVGAAAAGIAGRTLYNYFSGGKHEPREEHRDDPVQYVDVMEPAQEVSNKRQRAFVPIQVIQRGVAPQPLFTANRGYRVQGNTPEEGISAAQLRKVAA